MASSNKRDPPGTRSSSAIAPVPPPVMARTAWRPEACVSAIIRDHATSIVFSARPRSPEEQLAHLEPRLGGEGQGLHVDALVVAVEPPGHRLGGQRPREQAKAVGHRAALAKVG